jgi:DNA-binding NtrC family response regulator
MEVVAVDDKCVLIVEDDRAICAAWERALRCAGFEVDVADTLKDGIAKLEGHRLVLTDLNLPDGQSTALLRKVREMGWPIRVAVVTGSIDGRHVVEASGEHPEAFFEKPVDLERLLAWLGTPPIH